MTLARSLALAATFALAAPLAAQTPPETPALAPSKIVATAPLSDWVAIDPTDLLVMDLAPDARGRARRVVIQLMPPPFSQGWIGNIRMLAAAHWWDGTSINRVQDNYVVQWGDATEAKPLPQGLRTVPESDYKSRVEFGTQQPNVCIGQGLECPEWSRTPAFVMNRSADSYAPEAGFFQGWQISADEVQGNPIRAQTGLDGPMQDIRLIHTEAWPVHCYAMVGVGRNLSPDTGTGAELYTVIGHAPRHLDRNIALVGRVIEGIEHLSSLPRGTEALGFYATAEEHVPIVSVRIASELPAAEQPRFQYLSTESTTFARYADARANRRDPFFNVPAGGADICNIPVPVRRVPNA